ncbi:sulfatase [Bacteroidota bacterium]
MGKGKNNFNRREFIKVTSAGIFAAMLAGCESLSAEEKPNILFISVDDLRPELGCYGNKEIKTPNFDSLAEEGMMFTNTYCQAAACAPSRASLMTGLRPDTTRVWSLGEKFREIHPDIVTMPQHFKKFGYHTVSMGKIFHNHMPDPVSFDEPDLKPEEYMTPEMIDRDPESFYYDEELKKELAEVRKKRLEKNPNAYAGGWAYGKSYECSDAPDNAFYDGAQTDLAIETLKRLKQRKEPFYFALGYYRPHLPFVAPKKYWDLYDRDKLAMADNPYLPKNSPGMAINSMYELRGCYDLQFVKHPSEYKLPEETARILKHGYYASVSYVDACLGKLMKGLKDLGLDKNTIVVVWGDHGWKLGEHGSWCKQTNYNIDTRVPLLVKVPNMKLKSHKCEELTELVDLFPAMCDLAGIDIPSDMEGVSFKPLLKNPKREWKSAVFSQYHQRPKITPDGKRYMGYSMKTKHYHYVEWRYWNNDKKSAGDLAAIELYDNQSDSDENVNVVGNPENKEIIEKLAAQLKTGWKTAVPK